MDPWNNGLRAGDSHTAGMAIGAGGLGGDLPSVDEAADERGQGFRSKDTTGTTLEDDLPDVGLRFPSDVDLISRELVDQIDGCTHFLDGYAQTDDVHDKTGGDHCSGKVNRGGQGGDRRVIATAEETAGGEEDAHPEEITSEELAPPRQV